MLGKQRAKIFNPPQIN